MNQRNRQPYKNARILRHRDDELLRSVAAEIMVKDLREFEPQNFANIIWGYGRLGFDPGRPLDCIARLITRHA